MTAVGHGYEPASLKLPHGNEGKEPVAVLDQALWRELVTADTAEAFGGAWVTLACRIISGASAGILLLRGRAHRASPELVATFPAGTLADAGLFAAAQLAIKEGRGIVQPSPGAASAQKLLRAAYPIQLEGSVF